MKLHALSITLILAACSLATSARAQSVDPCNVYTCMAGISGVGATGGPSCIPATNYFFDDLVVWDHKGFDESATAALRTIYMNNCVGAQFASNEAILQTIVNIYYWTP